MAKKVYAVQAVLLVLVGFSSSIVREDSSIPILLFAAMCVLMPSLTIASYQGWTAPALEVTQIFGSVSNITTKPLPQMAPGSLWISARVAPEPSQPFSDPSRRLPSRSGCSHCSTASSPASS